MIDNTTPLLWEVCQEAFGTTDRDELLALAQHNEWRIEVHERGEGYFATARTKWDSSHSTPTYSSQAAAIADAMLMAYSASHLLKNIPPRVITA